MSILDSNLKLILNDYLKQSLNFDSTWCVVVHPPNFQLIPHKVFYPNIGVIFASTNKKLIHNFDWYVESMINKNSIVSADQIWNFQHKLLEFGKNKYKVGDLGFLMEVMRFYCYLVLYNKGVFKSNLFIKELKIKNPSNSVKLIYFSILERSNDEIISSFLQKFTKNYGEHSQWEVVTCIMPKIT